MNLWYWEYIIDYYDEVDGTIEERQGILAAEDIQEAMKLLCSYYGDTCIENIKTLQAFADMVIDFKDVRDHDFKVSYEGV